MSLVGTLSMAAPLVGKLAAGESLTGSLQMAPTLVGALSMEDTLVGTLTSAYTSLTGKLTIPYCGDESTIETYTGTYTVTPKAYEPSVLQTKGLRMLNNVAVLKVPYYETSNVSDGYTVYIAEE